MRKVFFTLCLSLSHPGWALTSIYDGDGQAAAPYLRLTANDKPVKQNIVDDKALMPGLPAKSKLKPGEFKSYQLDECQKLPGAFFVVGADELSINWLNTHKAHLAKIHAVGFVTNVSSQEEVDEIKRRISVDLIYTNVDELAAGVKAAAYPFFTNGCEVWQ